MSGFLTLKQDGFEPHREEQSFENQFPSPFGRNATHAELEKAIKADQIHVYDRNPSEWLMGAAQIYWDKYEALILD